MLKTSCSRAALAAFAALLAPALSACATPPSAEAYVEAPVRDSAAQLRELRNAEARLRQMRTVLDLDSEADADDVAAYDAARDRVLRLRGQFPTGDAGGADLGWDPLEALGKGAWQTGGTVPGGIGGKPVPSRG